MLWRWEYVILLIVLGSQLGETAVKRNNNNRSSKNKLRNKSIVKKPAKIQSRIVGGSTTSVSKTPYLVQVRRGSELCGGSIIADRWILTAAHCVKGHSPSQFQVRGGTNTLTGSDGVTRSVIFIAVAPKFTTKSMNMDAALLKLNQSMNGTNIATIAMAKSAPKAGSTVRIVGWGLTREGGSTSNQMRSAQIKVVGKTRCRKDYRSLATITNYMFCARGKNKDSCSGDSGGACTLNNKLVGIVSFGYGCGRAGYPGVYTTVSTIYKWANSVMANNS
ncbi:uncharacterized protein Dwil_GK19132 [Drosophila willistoni]|uniref:Peptidase S1 domain-containing protein n=2 Tax=Drosophila willistoni TaxID=7260 RepID=B4N3Q1_DROWI|nr:uncharacterized protein Dwil_GK19132 [Drosophila willistoni]